MKNENFISFEDLKKDLLSDSETKDHYDDLEETFEIISNFISLRNQLKLSQRDLSTITGVKQPSIARFESGQIKNLSFNYINKLIKPLGYKTKIIFEKV